MVIFSLQDKCNNKDLILQNIFAEYLFLFSLLIQNLSLYFVFYKKIVKMTEVITTIPEQIKKAMDGRTQRWLSFEVRISEYDLSRKFNGTIQFSDEEIAKIEERLSFKIER